VSPRPPEAPTFWIIAGANGSGKSSAYDRMSIDAPEGSVWIINPDLLTARIRDHEHLSQNDANLQAVRRIEKWLRASILAHQSVGVETVLSTPKYRKLVRLAKRQGFRVRLIYVTLKSAALNIERVRIRVAKGGHFVPDEKIVDRRRRSFGELPWFLAHADLAEILDNSGAQPELVADKIGDTIWIYGNFTPELKTAIDRTVAGDLRSSAKLHQA
jgi:predicted ABC-type ATPase